MTDLINRDEAIKKLMGQRVVNRDLKDIYYNVGLRTAVNTLNTEPAADLVPRPSKCIDGVIQEHDNGMVSMTKDTWETTKETLERYKGEIEDFYIATQYLPEKDKVEVVRCSDCKYKYPKDMDMFCRHFIGGRLSPDGYCWKGERK